MVSWVYMQLLREMKESDKGELRGETITYSLPGSLSDRSSTYPDLAPHGMDLITFGAAATRWAESRTSLFTSKLEGDASTTDIKRHFTEKNASTNLCLAIVNEGDPTPRLSKDYITWISSAASAQQQDGSKVKDALAKTPWHALLPFGQIVVLGDKSKSVQWIGKETFRKTVWIDPAQGEIDTYVANVEGLCK